MYPYCSHLSWLYTPASHRDTLIYFMMSPLSSSPERAMSPEMGEIDLLSIDGNNALLPKDLWADLEASSMTPKSNPTNRHRSIYNDELKVDYNDLVKLGSLTFFCLTPCSGKTTIAQQTVEAFSNRAHDLQLHCGVTASRDTSRAQYKPPLEYPKPFATSCDGMRNNSHTTATTSITTTTTTTTNATSITNSNNSAAPNSNTQGNHNNSNWEVPQAMHGILPTPGRRASADPHSRSAAAPSTPNRRVSASAGVLPTPLMPPKPRGGALHTPPGGHVTGAAEGVLHSPGSRPPHSPPAARAGSVNTELPHTAPRSMPRPHNMPPDMAYNMAPDMPHNVPHNMPHNLPLDMPHDMPHNMPPDMPHTPFGQRRVRNSVEFATPDKPGRNKAEEGGGLGAHGLGGYVPYNMPHSMGPNMPPDVPHNMPHNVPSMPHNMPHNMPPNMPPDMPHHVPSDMPHHQAWARPTEPRLQTPSPPSARLRGPPSPTIESSPPAPVNLRSPQQGQGQRQGRVPVQGQRPAGSQVQAQGPAQGPSKQTLDAVANLVSALHTQMGTAAGGGF